MSDQETALKLVEQLERLGCKVDIILPDGTHRYRSTHCRHGKHDDCAAATMAGTVPRNGRANPRQVQIERRPAQCKTCGAPCRCTDAGCVHPTP